MTLAFVLALVLALSVGVWCSSSLLLLPLLLLLLCHKFEFLRGRGRRSWGQREVVHSMKDTDQLVDGVNPVLPVLIAGCDELQRASAGEVHLHDVLVLGMKPAPSTKCVRHGCMRVVRHYTIRTYADTATAFSNGRTSWKCLALALGATQKYPCCIMTKRLRHGWPITRPFSFTSLHAHIVL